jgi:hypothetical protein
VSQQSCSFTREALLCNFSTSVVSQGLQATYFLNRTHQIGQPDPHQLVVIPANLSIPNTVVSCVFLDINSQQPVPYVTNQTFDAGTIIINCTFTFFDKYGNLKPLLPDFSNAPEIYMDGQERGLEKQTFIPWNDSTILAQLRPNKSSDAPQNITLFDPVSGKFYHYFPFKIAPGAVNVGHTRFVLSPDQNVSVVIMLALVLN